jgi:hypothetical protein
MRMRNEKTGTWGAGLQAATISPHKPGFVEKSLHRHGGLCMADVRPEKDNSWHVDPDQVVLPGKPYRLDFVMLPAATVRIELVDGNESPIAGQHVSIKGDQMPPSLSVLGHGKTGEDGRFTFAGIPAGYSWWFSLQREGSRDEVRSLPFAPVQPGQYQMNLRLRRDAQSGIDLLEITGVTDSQGTEIGDQVLRDDPFARSPVGPELQAKAREILQKMAEANRYWLGPPPSEVQSYQYVFHLADNQPQSFRITQPATNHTWTRQGITYFSALHHLTAHPEEALFRQVDVGDDEITLVYHLSKTTRVSSGNGLLRTWKGFSSRSVREGKLTVDPQTYTPLEHIARGVRERPLQYVEIRPGCYVPLRIRIDEGPDFDRPKYDWTFRVYEPGLWLFDTSRTESGEYPDGIIARIQNVKVNGRDGQVIHHAGKES